LAVLGVTYHQNLDFGIQSIINLIVGLQKNKLMKIFKSLIQDPDLECEFIDGSIVKAHQHSMGAASDEDEAIGKSIVGNTTKIHMAVDVCVFPIDFEITGG